MHTCIIASFIITVHVIFFMLYFWLLILDESDVLPEISPFIGSVEHVIEEGVANAQLGFSVASVQATVIDGM